MTMKFSAPCIFGLEGLCANELRYLGVENVNAENGRVTFTGDWSTLALANINSRYAERILILLAEFEVHTFDDLFEGVKAIPWEDYIGISEAFPVKGRCLDSDLMSVPDCQKIVKKAVADRLSQKYMLPWFDETGAPHQIQFLILRNKVSIMLDTSGAGLHKRGYRADSNDAPIKETLAAAMVDLSRVRANHFVTDPMCGSGTILIEAAMKALNIAPGLNRYFACEHWNCVPKDVFETARENARQKIRHDATFRATGYDIDDSALAIAKKNAEATGGSFTKTNSMEEAFKDADIVYPKSWAPFAAMEKRTNLYADGDFDGIDKLEKELLTQNAEHKDWACTEELMKTTKDGKALYLHCLPADITGVSCETGEVDGSVFDRYRIPLYKEASFKPYIIAAMILLAKFENPQNILKKLEVKAAPRIFE